MLRESFGMSWQNIIHNKMRSFLTILGIVIGVAAIITLVTLVQGATSQVTEEFSSLGAGKITVVAQGTALKQGLSDNDLNSLSKIFGVSGVSPTVSTQTTVVRNGILQEKVAIEGKDETYFQKNEKYITSGRGINILDVENRNNVCLINPSIEKKLFSGENPIGQSIILGGQSYLVIGVFDSSSSSDLTAQMLDFSLSTSDFTVMLPYKTAMRFSGARSITSLDIYVSDTSKTEDVTNQIHNVLDQAFNYTEDSYSIMNMDSLLSSMNSVTSLMSALIGGIASIALLVGGIGIMNMMLVSVTERTKEIGLRKALGAEPRRIQLQFLIESVVLSLLGGLFGLLFGLGLSWMICFAIGAPYRISVGVIALAVGFSAAVGIIFGWVPARKASMLNPIDALRSE